MAIAAPTDISGCSLWIDASDASSITATGSDLDQINDKSGNANHATAASGTKPETGTKTQNNKNVLDFTSSDFLTFTSVPTSITNGTVFCVCKYPQQSQCIHLSSGDGSGPYVMAAQSGSASTGISLDSGTGYEFSVNNKLRITDGDGTTRWNLWNDTINLEEYFVWAIKGIDFSLWSGLLYNGYKSASFASSVELGELIIYDSALSEANATDVAQYLIAKWAIPFQTFCDPNIVDYLDSRDTSRITQASGAVSAWRGGMDVIQLDQATGAAQPTTGVETIGSENAIGFDGTSDYLSAVNTMHDGTGDYCVAGMVDIGTVDATFDAAFSINGSVDWTFYANSAAQFNGAILTTDDGDLSLTGGPYSGPTLYALIFDFTNGTLTVNMNGTAVGTGSYTTKTDATLDLILMSTRGKGNFLAGSVGGLVITESVDIDTVQKIEGQLAHEFAQTALLPANHPYKTEKPLACGFRLEDEAAAGGYGRYTYNKHGLGLGLGLGHGSAY